jgi:hypothetical protein
VGRSGCFTCNTRSGPGHNSSFITKPLQFGSSLSNTCTVLVLVLFPAKLNPNYDPFLFVSENTQYKRVLTIKETRLIHSRHFQITFAVTIYCLKIPQHRYNQWVALQMSCGSVRVINLYQSPLHVLQASCPFTRFNR